MGSGPLNEDTFWEIIESFGWTHQGNDALVMEPAVKTLAGMTLDDLTAFEQILTEKLYALDTQAHGTANGFGSEHFSVDSFLYARCCVVVNGRAFYERVLENPALMVHELEFEAVLYLASYAAERIGVDDFLAYVSLSYETFSNEAGWADAEFPDGLPPGHKPKHQR